jgi:hypothetical protein
MANEKRLIDANALMEMVGKRLKNPLIFSWLCSFVKDAPTVDAVEVVHGRWIRQDEHDPDWWGYTDTHLYCSACMEEANSQYKYCPHCGAKMDGGNEDG